jgi:Flp pilus assembly protein TadD
VISLLKSAALLAIVATGLACPVAFAATPEAANPGNCRKLRLHGKNSEATSCFEALARSGDPYLMGEGYWGLEDYQKAKVEFEIAVSKPGSPALWHVRYGMMFHERFNNIDAAKLYEEALEIEPGNAQAYLGLAELSADGFDSKAGAYIAKALASDPKLVAAHEFAADLALEDATPEEAVKEADIAIGLSPYAGGSDALDAMAIRAAVDLLADKTADAQVWLDKIKAVNPGYGEAEVIVARQLVLNRRYTDAVAYYRKAVAADPRLWIAHSELGINLMRLGEEDEPFQELALAYKNGQTDIPTSNSLKLLESYKNFVTYKDPTTILRLDKKEADLLRPYFEEQLHKSIATYSAKYKMKLDGPVQLEVYPNHDDFAVRTMGMPGLGALGVTFGEVVAMDSPSGRTPGEFNWGATLWHEMSHVFILTATRHRVPRWFTEGLAVHEEGAANPEWANRLTPEVVVAIKDKKLLPVNTIDRGFIFPEYPEQVIVSYYQAGTICDYISERWGDDALLGMVHSFAELKTTPETIQANLHESSEEFDKDYAAWLQKRTGSVVENFDAWRKGLKALVGISKDDDAVIAMAPGLIQMYPEYVGDANAYEYLAGAQMLKSNKQAAMDTLVAYEKMGGENPGALKKLASIEEDLGHPKEAAATLDRLNFIYPEDESMHRHLGDLWLTQNNDAGAVREFNAVLALKPLDMASAEFSVAKAYYAEGQKDKAEESVLASLEAAPGYKPAQKLLLEMEAGKSSDTVTNPPALKPAQH